MKAINVFVVDDDDIYQFTTGVNLKSIPNVKSIKNFYDGAEAMEHILEHQNDENQLPDLIFLDINMPVMDGFQFMAEFTDLLPKLNKKIKVYMVSSSLDTKDMERSKRIDAIADYLVKPVSSMNLKEILSKM
jgi:CheY-like chemotaxis protein|nr:response regulator [uncultured Allomuricauda sp.]